MANLKTFLMFFVLLIEAAKVGCVQADELLRQENDIRQSSQIVRINQQIVELACQEQWTEIIKFASQTGEEIGAHMGTRKQSLILPHTINMIGQAYGKIYFQNKNKYEYVKEGQLFFVFCMSIIEQANVSQDVKKSIYAWNHYYNLLNRKILTAQFLPAISIKDEPVLNLEE